MGGRQPIAKNERHPGAVVSARVTVWLLSSRVRVALALPPHRVCWSPVAGEGWCEVRGTTAVLATFGRSMLEIDAKPSIQNEEICRY